MTLNDYMELAARTDNVGIETDPIKSRTLAAMGMVGEAAECLDHLKKVIAQGHELDSGKLIEEAGDCLWYVAKMARACNVTLEDVATFNISKLAVRYPSGFSAAASVNRREYRND